MFCGPETCRYFTRRSRVKYRPVEGPRNIMFSVVAVNFCKFFIYHLSKKNKCGKYVFVIIIVPEEKRNNKINNEIFIHFANRLSICSAVVLANLSIFNCFQCFVNTEDTRTKFARLCKGQIPSNIDQRTRMIYGRLM